MFPSKNSPNYGVFVKNFMLQMEEESFLFVSRALIIGKSQNVFSKFVKYIKFICELLLKGWFTTYDVMYVHQVSHSAPFVWLMLKFKNARFVLNFHGDDALVRNRIDRFFFFFSKKVVKRANLVVVPSIYFKDIVVANFEIDPSKIFVSPSGGIDPKVFYVDKSREINISRKKLTVITVCRLDEGKGLETLINSLKNKSDIIEKIYIVGSGPLEPELKLLSKTLNLDNLICFIPMQDQNKLLYYLHKSNLFIFPSERESLGLVGIEAMASGLPIIGSNIGGILSYLKDGVNGLSFEVGSCCDLARKIEHFYNLSFEDRFRLSNGAIQTAQEFNKNLVIQLLKLKLNEIFKHA